MIDKKYEKNHLILSGSSETGKTQALIESLLIACDMGKKCLFIFTEMEFQDIESRVNSTGRKLENTNFECAPVSIGDEFSIIRDLTNQCNTKIDVLFVDGLDKFKLDKPLIETSFDIKYSHDEKVEKLNLEFKKLINENNINGVTTQSKILKGYII